MGLAYDVHVIDITRGEQNDPNFVRISPNAKIPAIVDPEGPAGVPISVFESGAILIYLGKRRDFSGQPIPPYGSRLSSG
jgi:GSH-dependent disulfide-bond oxidoreductase